MMTLGHQHIAKHRFFDICMKLELTPKQILTKLKRIRQVLLQKGKTLGKSPYNGHALVSLILPDDLNYIKGNDGSKAEPAVKVHKGVMYEGVLNKAILGAAHNSITQVLHKEYGVDRAALFVDEIQYITNGWLLVRGFSIGMKDCMIPEKHRNQEQEIKDMVCSCYVKADRAATTTQNPHIAESRIGAALSDARNMGQRLARDALPEDNNLLQPILSGSKGSMFNATQIFGALGQQSISGGRPKYEMSNGARGLVHYPHGEMPAEMRYESRGFVRSSFGEGLTPREMWWHAASGREGVINTAMSTADSGYIQRQMVKVMEDMRAMYDGTIRDTTGRIFQFAYNEDGYDPVHTVKVDGSQEAVDIGRLVDRLNMEFETGMNQ